MVCHLVQCGHQNWPHYCTQCGIVCAMDYLLFTKQQHQCTVKIWKVVKFCHAKIMPFLQNLAVIAINCFQKILRKLFDA